MVSHAQAAAEVEVVDADARGLQSARELQRARQRVAVRRQVGQLRADVTGDAADAQVGVGARAFVDRERARFSQAEFVLAQAGGNVRMGVGVDIGVQAHRHRRDFARFRGRGADAMQLVFRFDVEAGDAGRQRFADFPVLLADAGENGFVGGAAGRQHAPQFAAGHDVKTAAQARQHIQHREVAVGFDRVADAVRVVAEGGVEGAPVTLQRGARIHIARRAGGAADVGERHLLSVQAAVDAVEVVHAVGAGGDARAAI